MPQKWRNKNDSNRPTPCRVDECIISIIIGTRALINYTVARGGGGDKTGNISETVEDKSESYY